MAIKKNLLLISALNLFAFGAAAMAQDYPDSTLLRLLPGEKDLTAWRQTFVPRFFGRENLFEYINGAADLYLQYGFRRVLTTDYAVGPDSSSVTLEIYSMKSPLHAFAIFAAERSPEEVAVEVGVEGYRSANVLNFYQGACYVKMTSFALEKDLGAVLEEMGRFLASRIGGEDAPPAMFTLFPLQDRLQASDRYVPGDFLSQSYFREGYRREYRSDTCGSYQLFLVPCRNVEEGKALFEKYTGFLLQRNDPHRPETIDGHPALLVQGREKMHLVFYTDAFVGGGMGAPCESIIRAQVEQLAGQLGGQ